MGWRMGAGIPVNFRVPAMPPANSAIYCILNGAAGTSAAKASRHVVADMFAAQGTPAIVELVRNGGEIAALVHRAVATGCTTIVAGGGDGTVSCVAGIVARSSACLGILPMGTLNHFARDLKIPLPLAEAVHVVVHGEERRVDAGEVNGHLFVNNSSLGLYPRLVREREALQLQGNGKWLAFARALGPVLRGYSQLQVEVRGDAQGPARHTTPFVFIGNNRYRLNGWRIGSRDALDAGRLWICTAPGKGPIGLVALALAALAGRVEQGGGNAFETGECWIKSRKRYLHVATDGEVRRLATPLHYRSLPGALRVIAPPQAALATGGKP